MNNVSILKVILIVFANIFILKIALPSSNQSSGGIVAVLFQPDYGKFSNTVSAAGQPKFESNILLIGGDTTFTRRGFLSGGRVLYGSTTTSSISTSASSYEIKNIGLKVGYSFDMSIIDFKIGSYFGFGNLTFNSYTTTQSGSADVDYLFIEPFAMIGIAGGRNFQASVGGGYHYAFTYKVTTYGTNLISDPSSTSVGGVNIIFELSFGEFGR